MHLGLDQLPLDRQLDTFFVKLKELLEQRYDTTCRQISPTHVTNTLVERQDAN